jgi:hypothetical protein
MDDVGDALTNSYWSWIQVFNSYLVYNLFFACTARGTTALADLAPYIYMCSLSLRTHNFGLLHTRFREFLWCTSYGERERERERELFVCIWGLGFVRVLLCRVNLCSLYYCFFYYSTHYYWIHSQQISIKASNNSK